MTEEEEKEDRGGRGDGRKLQSLGEGGKRMGSGKGKCS